MMAQIQFCTQKPGGFKDAPSDHRYPSMILPKENGTGLFVVNSSTWAENYLPAGWSQRERKSKVKLT